MTTNIKNDQVKSSRVKENIQKSWDVAIMRMGKLGEQRHMSALRDGFALLVPLIISASIGVICMTFIFGWGGAVTTSILGWIAMNIEGQTVTSTHNVISFAPGSNSLEISTIGIFVFFTIWKGTFSYLSLFLAITLSYSFARIKSLKDPFIAAIVGLLAFFILTFGDPTLFGTTGFLISILSSFISMEIYSKLESNPKLVLTMPNGVPPAVARSFSKVFPAMITLFAMIAIQAPFIIMMPLITSNPVSDVFGIGHAISLAIQAPFIGIASSSAGSLSLGLVYTFFVGLLWFFGIHGSNILLAIFQPITLVMMENNIIFRENPLDPALSPSAFAGGTLDAYVFIGGAGVTLAFVIVSLLLSKSKVHREIIKFGGPASVFNINEPLLFGVPMILNFRLFVPFIFTQPILYIITWLAIEEFRWVPPVIILIPWTAPIGVGGFLASGWQGILLALFNLAVAMTIYLPFILLNNKIAKKKGEELVKINYKDGFKKIGNTFNKKGLNKHENK